MAVGGALFSSGGRATPASKALVEFRAGKMNLSGTMVTPDKRKGLVMIEQGDDDLMHFKWKDRTSNNVEDDLIIFPDDIEFKRVTQCTTGRVFILKFKSSTRKLFFWMQEPKEDKDEEFCKKVNDYLNNPPSAGSSGSGRGSSNPLVSGGGIPGLDMSNLRDSELHSLLNHMSQHQLMQLLEAGNLLGGTGSGSSTRQRSSARQAAAAAAAASASPALPASTPAVATPAIPAVAASTATGATAAPVEAASAPASSGSAAGKAPIQLSDLQSILSGIKVPSGATGSSDPEVDLAAGLTLDVLQPLLENPEFVDKMKNLLPEIPTSESPATEIKGTVSSPQFKQALSLFSSGLQTGQLAPLIREFGLGDEAVAAATAGDMEAFVKALQKKEAKKEDEEGMELD